MTQTIATTARRCACVLALAGALAGCETAPTRAAQEDPALRRAEAMAHVERAESLAAAGKTDDAIGAYREAINASPRIATAWNNLGELLLRKKQYADAVSAFETAGDLQPTDPRPLYNAGVVYQQAGWAEDAFEQFSRSLERDPNYLPALRGGIRSADMLTRSTRQTHEWVKRASMLETNPEWREYLERQRFRIETGLELQTTG